MLKRGVDTVAAVLCVFRFEGVRLIQPLAKFNQSAVLQGTRFVLYISAALLSDGGEEVGCNSN